MFLLPASLKIHSQFLPFISGVLRNATFFAQNKRFDQVECLLYYVG